jgi:dTDP-4-dehydrorhamnose reductase
VFVFGSHGQVTRSLQLLANDRSDIVLGVGRRGDVDILEPAAVYSALKHFSPDIVVNPAAFTLVDRAEAEPELALAVNRDGARYVAEASQRVSAPIVHLSTDYVFDGTKESPYTEADSAAPMSVYGRSKLEGERAVIAANEQHIILRTAWVYSPFGNNFVKTMVSLSEKVDRLRVVDDQIGCPTYALDLAAAIVSIAKSIKYLGWRQSFAGITHVAGPDEITWCGFARQIMASLTKHGQRAVPVDAIGSADYPTAATRPTNSRLNCQRAASLFEVRMPPLHQSLDRCIASLLAQR